MARLIIAVKSGSYACNRAGHPFSPKGLIIAAASPAQAVFLTGSLLRHIVVMVTTSSIGLVTMFLVDFVDLLYIAQLGDPALTAAMGFAATILFFATALNIGLMIAVSALGARKIGQGEGDYARRYLSNVLITGLLFVVPMVLGFTIFAPQLVALLGASEAAQIAAAGYIRIVAPFLLFSVTSMVCSGFLRAHGAARQAMNVTLGIAIVNAVLDPIFIFGFGWGMAGAAIATVCAMIFAALYAIAVIMRQYGGFHAFSLSELRADVRPILAIMLPAVLTNLATPVGGFITYRFIAGYSDDIVAGYAVVGRIVPVAFCLLFSLSGAIGPIVGQNFGAGQFDRVRAALYQAAGFALGYALLIWPLLYILSQPIGDLFKLGSDGQYVLWLFTAIAAPLFAFNGILFIANAAFNNLDRASWSTALNWGRNTVGIVPLIWLGQPAFGVAAVLLAPAIGGIGFGLLGFWLAVRLVDQRAAERRGAGEAAPAAIAPG